MHNILYYFDFDFDGANDVFRLKLRYNDMIWYRRIDDIAHLLNLYFADYITISNHLRQHVLLQRITESDEKY